MEETVKAKNEIPETPPLFKIAENDDKGKGNLFLYRAAISGVLIIVLIVFKIFFSDVYAVLDSWLTEKFNLVPLSF